MASIRERNGKFNVIYSYTNEKGERKQKWETYETKAEAKRRKKEIEYKKEMGSFVVRKCKTLDELITEYVALYGKENWALSTYEGNVSLINNYMFGSQEGKSLWIAQSLPVTPWQVLRAKLDMQLILNSMPVMLCMICTAVVCLFKIGQFVMMILQVLSYVFVMAVFGLFMGVIKPVLTWTNELTPIKQSASVMITMFGGFGYTALLFMYGIDMEKEQYSKLISDIPEPDIAISMGCNVGYPFIGRPFDDNWGLDDPTGKSDEDFIKVINQIELKIKNMIDRMK